MAAMASVVAVTDAMKDVAGIMVWWELSGQVDHEDLIETLKAELHNLPFFTEKDFPLPPNLSTALARAAGSVMSTKRQLFRPLARRGAWEIVQEEVVKTFDDDMNAQETLSYRTLLQGRVDKSAAGETVVLTGDDHFREETLKRIPKYRGVLMSSDISDWLLWVANHRMMAVGLRNRGGFYFIPNDRVAAWRGLVNVLRACSNHRMYEIPAMRTAEAVEAILSNVRDEANQQMVALEQWFADNGADPSTRGLNAAAAKAEQIQQKLNHYCQLLGVTTPDLAERLERLTGTIQAAKIVASAE